MRTYCATFYNAFTNPITYVGLTVIWAIIVFSQFLELHTLGWVDLIAPLVMVALLYGAVFLTLPLLLAPLTWLSLRAQASVKGTRRAALTDHSILVQGDAFRSEIPLRNLTRVRRTRHLMLFMTRPNCAIVVPNAAFDSPEAANAFFAEASARWQAARGKPAAKTHLDGKS